MNKRKATQRGVALVAVLWLVAAMSLIIVGVVRAVRIEVQSAGMHRQAVIANFLADAAILMALQSLHAQQKDPGSTLQMIPVQFENQSFDVSVQPLNGFIDINNASVQLLEDMYRHASGLNSSEAQSLAQATIGFDAIEDLMRVPAMTYDLYAKISPIVTASLKGGSGRVNPMAAPIGVLQVLTGGDGARAATLVAGRGADSKLTDTSFLKPDQIEMASSRSLLFEVRINLPDRGSLQRTWQVFWGSDPRSGIPWRILYKQQSIRHLAQAEN